MLKFKRLNQTRGSILKKIIIFTAFILTCKITNAQDPVFSQFYNSPLQMNPAFAGSTNGPLFHLNYRNQWPGLGQIYTTYALSYSQFLGQINSGLGFSLLTDNAGDGILKTTRIAGNYAYRLKINQHTYIKGGIEVGLGNMSLDWDRFTFGDAIDPRLGSVSPGGAPFPSRESRPEYGSLNYLLISSGVLLSHPDYYAGIGLRNLNTPDISFANGNSGQSNKDSFLPVLMSLHGGFKIVLQKGNKNNDDTFLMPNLLFTTQGGYSQLNSGAVLSLDKIFFGAWYRVSGWAGDALIGSVGVRKDFIKITYSFDYTTSALSIRQGGSHEVGIVLNFDEFFPVKTNYNDCFNIFR